jgi:hypothetical protein
MTIARQSPPPQSISPTPAPLDASRKCPYCAPDAAPALSFGPTELRLLGHFLGSSRSNQGGQP